MKLKPLIPLITAMLLIGGTTPQAAVRPQPSRDITPPTVPSGITASAASSSQINLSWKASMDQIGVKGYKVYRNRTQIANVTGTAFSENGLAANTTYGYTVSAYDAAGNTSAQSRQVSAKTLTTPGGSEAGPTIPDGLSATPVSSSQINLSWAASTDPSGIQGYYVFRNDTEIATVSEPSYSDSGLTPSTVYEYNVSAFNADGDTSAKSASIYATPSGGSTDATVGYLGCSMTMDAIEGAIALGDPTFWNPVPTYNSGGLYAWAKNLTDSNSFWSGFQKAYNAQPTKTIWWELCALSKDATSETYDNALKVLNEIKRRVPGASVYVSAQPSYAPSSHECNIAGIGGQSRMASIASQLVANGKALTGPVVGPLAYPGQTIKDGCHANTLGEELMGQQLIDFFN
ncbi:MAG: fibronectin type III domain-containing protein [Methylosarcina sp.]